MVSPPALPLCVEEPQSAGSLRLTQTCLRCRTDISFPARRGPRTRTARSPRTIAFALPAATSRTIELAIFRVLAKGDLDAGAALASAVGCPPLASAVGCPPPRRSLTPPRRPLSSQRGRAARGCCAAEIVRKEALLGPVPPRGS